MIRGFAPCGILLANVKPIAHRGGELGAAHVPETTAATVPHLQVDQRFFPIFSLLFGVGFSLLLESARARARHPRVVLLRRLLAVAATVLLTPWARSVVRLRRCYQGPVKWLWRGATWWQRPPLRRPAVAPHRAGEAS